MSQDIKQPEREEEIELFSRLQLLNIFPGRWKSIYKGRGIQFADKKPFRPGDNPRDLDLHTLIRSGKKIIIQRVVRRQLKIHAWADFSGSMHRFKEMFFPHKPDIRDMALRLIFASGVYIYSPISFYPFGVEKEHYFPPRMGEAYYWEILKWIKESGNLLPISSGIETALESLMQFAIPHNMVFCISDFKQRAFDGDFVDLLEPAATRFDFIPVVIRDPLEKEGQLTRSVRIKVQSSSSKKSTGEIYLTPKLLEEIQAVSQQHLLNLKDNFRRLEIDCIVLDSSSIDDCQKVFSDFFQTRKRQR